MGEQLRIAFLKKRMRIYFEKMIIIVFYFILIFSNA